MKLIHAIIILFIYLQGISQNNTELKISQKQLSEVKTISDILPIALKDCSLQEIIVTTNVGGIMKDFTCKGELFSPDLKKNLLKKEKGQWFFIKILRSTCSEYIKKNYKLTIE